MVSHSSRRFHASASSCRLVHRLILRTGKRRLWHYAESYRHDRHTGGSVGVKRILLQQRSHDGVRDGCVHGEVELGICEQRTEREPVEQQCGCDVTRHGDGAGECDQPSVHGEGVVGRDRTGCEIDRQCGRRFPDLCPTVERNDTNAEHQYDQRGLRKRGCEHISDAVRNL